MANIISTVMTYPLNGSTVDFAIPFEYLARKFVKVTLVGTNRQELVINQDYRFTTRTQVTTTRAWGPSDGYEFIEIRRYTSATDRLVDFADGSILRAYDLNISQVQTLHVADEARNLTADTIGVNNDGNLDARGRRIVNVADGIDAGDVVTVRQQQAWADSALNQADRAKTEADRAKTEADRVTSQATISSSAAAAALVSEGKAKTSEDNAKASETTAGVSASSATGSAAAALVSEGKAKTSEDNAKASELRAITEANKLGNMNDLANNISSINTTTHDVAFKGKLSVAVNGSSPRDVVSVEQLTARDTQISTLQTKVVTLEKKPYIVRRVQLPKTHSYTDVGMRTEWSDGYLEVSGSVLGDSTVDTTFYLGGVATIIYNVAATEHFYSFAQSSRNLYVSSHNVGSTANIVIRSGVPAQCRVSIYVTGRWKD